MNKVGGDLYISGSGAKNYMEEQKFIRDGIALKYFKFEPLKYPQRWKGFESYLSALDLLFNLGDESIEYLYNFED